MRYNYTNYNTNYLQHHGVLGQKWGIRRYQNADGSLTAEGKRRYDREDRQYSEDERRKYLLSKTPSEMSNNELTETIKRLENERKLNALMYPTGAAMKFVETQRDDLLKTVNSKVNAAASSYIEKFLNYAISAVMDNTILKNRNIVTSRIQTYV